MMMTCLRFWNVLDCDNDDTLIHDVAAEVPSALLALLKFKLFQLIETGILHGPTHGRGKHADGNFSESADCSASKRYRFTVGWLLA